MLKSRRVQPVLTTILVVSLMGCASAPPPAPPPIIVTAPPPAPPPPAPPLPEPEPLPIEEPEIPGKVVKVRVVVTPKTIPEIPKGSRIVITEIDGMCSGDVQNALMRRLVDNADYDVLTRDNLRQIMVESKQGWLGDFDSRTSVQLGDLLSASLFIVGRVIYCGSPPQPHLDSSDPLPFSILAVLQILDLRTGKVLVSAATEGKYYQQNVPLLVAADARTRPLRVQQDLDIARSRHDFSSEIRRTHSLPAIEEREDSEPPKVSYPALKAAEDLANNFADKFFSRSTWEDVEMWTSPSFGYSEGIQLVKLGHCGRAVKLLSQQARRELLLMPDGDVARYLHNYGVALLCDNKPEAALSKLQSAYRIDYDPATLRMMDLAARIMEWSLTVEVDQEPEVDVLVRRLTATDP